MAPFDIKELRDLTAYDELELDTLGEKKTALFVIISDTDATFNFIVSIMYSQLFNLLCDKADDVYNGRLPIHVRRLLDEFAVMDGSKCIMQLRGVRPFFSDKFDITKHKQYPLLSDYDKKNEFDIEKYVKNRNILRFKRNDVVDEVCDVEEIIA